jgi:hypothetical protein
MLWVAGQTGSASLVTVNPVQSGLSGPQNLFVQTLDFSGNIRFSTYFGSTGSDISLTLALPVRDSILAMWIRGIAGVLLCLTGAVWIAQGTNALGGSSMSGHGQWTVIGVVLVLLGLALLVLAWRKRAATRPR